MAKTSVLAQYMNERKQHFLWKINCFEYSRLFVKVFEKDIDIVQIM